MGPLKRKLVSIHDLDEASLRKLAKLKGAGEADDAQKLILRLKGIYFQGFKIFLPEDGGDPELIPNKLKKKHIKALHGEGPRVTRQRATRSKVQGDARHVAGPSTSHIASSHEPTMGPQQQESSDAIVPQPSPSSAPRARTQAAPRTLNTIPPPPASQPPKRGRGARTDIPEENQQKQHPKPPAPRETNITERQLAAAYEQVLQIEQILTTINVQKEEDRTKLLDDLEKAVDAIEEDLNEFVKIRLRLERTIMGWKNGLPPMQTEVATVKFRGVDEKGEAQTKD